MDNADQCKKGKVLQIRGCAGDTCHYDKENKGPIRKEDCVNLNKFCPGNIKVIQKVSLLASKPVCRISDLKKTQQKSRNPQRHEVRDAYNHGDYTNNKGIDQSVSLRVLVCIFVIRLCINQVLS